MVLCPDLLCLILLGIIVVIHRSKLSKAIVCIYALVLADVIDQLHEVIVKVASAHHFQITAVLIVGAVHKHNRTLGDALPSAGDPFVPARDKHDGRIGLYCAVKLLCKIIAVQIRIRIGIVMHIVEASAVIIGLTVQNGIAKAQLWMLSYGNVDDLVLALEVFKYALRTGKVHPGPAALLIGLVGPLRHFDIEELSALGRAFLFYRNDHGLALKVKPRIGTILRSIDLIINLLHGFARVGIGIKHDLRDFPAILGVFIQDAHDDLYVMLVNAGIGGVKE